MKEENINQVQDTKRGEEMVIRMWNGLLGKNLLIG